MQLVLAPTSALIVWLKRLLALHQLADFLELLVNQKQNSLFHKSILPDLIYYLLHLKEKYAVTYENEKNYW